jgi:hypothetical protein
MLTDRMASPPAWTSGYRVQACRSGESAIAVEALMNIAGSGETQHGADARVSSSGRRWGNHVSMLRQVGSRFIRSAAATILPIDFEK